MPRTGGRGRGVEVPLGCRCPHNAGGCQLDGNFLLNKNNYLNPWSTTSEPLFLYAHKQPATPTECAAAVNSLEAHGIQVPQSRHRRTRHTRISILGQPSSQGSSGESWWFVRVVKAQSRQDSVSVGVSTYNDDGRAKHGTDGRHLWHFLFLVFPTGLLLARSVVGK